jgi:hypothetical protein
VRPASAESDRGSGSHRSGIRLRARAAEREDAPWASAEARALTLGRSCRLRRWATVESKPAVRPGHPRGVRVAQLRTRERRLGRLAPQAIPPSPQSALRCQASRSLRSHQRLPARRCSHRRAARSETRQSCVAQLSPSNRRRHTRSFRRLVRWDKDPRRAFRSPTSPERRRRAPGTRASLLSEPGSERCTGRVAALRNGARHQPAQAAPLPLERGAHVRLSEPGRYRRPRSRQRPGTRPDRIDAGEGRRLDSDANAVRPRARP